MLNKLVFKPFLRSVEARDAKTTHMRAEASTLREKGEALRAKYAEGMAGARKGAADAKRALRVAGIDDKEARIQSARAEASEAQSKAEAELKGQFDAAREQLRRAEAEHLEDAIAALRYQQRLHG